MQSLEQFEIRILVGKFVACCDLVFQLNFLVRRGRIEMAYSQYIWHTEM